MNSQTTSLEQEAILRLTKGIFRCEHRQQNKKRTSPYWRRTCAPRMQRTALSIRQGEDIIVFGFQLAGMLA